MKTGLRKRFYPESITGIITTIAFLYTLVVPDWIEAVFHVDPDAGNGSAERLVVGVMVAITVALFVAAGYEWRRASAKVA